MNCHGDKSPRNDNSESGRSLIEMLGVLAVMGVLTIGAITGFNYAMNKQHANATVNYVNQLAIEGSRQMLAGSNHLSLLDYPDKTPSGYGVELGLLKDTNAYFEVYVKEVPEAVCSQIQAMAEGWRGLDTLWINEDGKDCNKELNTMSFIFTDSLSRGTSGTRCTSDEGCTGCQTCQRGFCTDTDSACTGDTPNCVSGSCETCPAGEFQDNKGKCYKCNESKTVWVADKAECDKCLGTRVCNGTTSYPCDTKATLYWGVQQEACQACGNRYVTNAADDGTGSCDYCDGTVITAENGEQFCHGNCPEGEIWVRSKCEPCDGKATYEWTYKPDCVNNCRGSHFFFHQYKKCVSCDSPVSWLYHTNPESCLACGNRYFIVDKNENPLGSCYYCKGTVTENGTACEWDCPEDSFGAQSKCWSCDDPTVGIHTASEIECKTHCQGKRIYHQGQCVRCDYTGGNVLYYADKESCLACGNWYWKGGHCYRCGGTVSADGKSCITE